MDWFLLWLSICFRNPVRQPNRSQFPHLRERIQGCSRAINEGHYLVFEANGYALSNPSDGTKQFGATKATAAHDAKAQRWVIHGVAEEGVAFKITSAVDGLYISQHSSLSVSVSGAEVYNVVYIGNSQYTLQKENGRYLNIAADGTISFASKPVPYSVYSVTYNY
jgi:phospholipase C